MKDFYVFLDQKKQAKMQMFAGTKLKKFR